MESDTCYTATIAGGAALRCVSYPSAGGVGHHRPGGTPNLLGRPLWSQSPAVMSCS